MTSQVDNVVNTSAPSTPKSNRHHHKDHKSEKLIYNPANINAK